MAKKPKKRVEYSLASEIKDVIPCFVMCCEESPHTSNHLEVGKEYKCVDTYEFCGKMYLLVEVEVRGEIKNFYYHESRFEKIN